MPQAIIPRRARYAKRVASVILFLFVVLLTAGCIMLADCNRAPDLQSDPGTWRDGFCIYTCEPVNGPALSYKVWRQEQDDWWICECSDGHLYVIP